MKRALLLSSGVNARLNYPRYLNDLTLFYRLLLSAGYGKADIRVCYARGALDDIDGDGAHGILHPATRAQVQGAFSWLAQLGAGDQLLVVVSNHGRPGGASLHEPDGVWTPADLTMALGPCQATKVLVFGQCYSGIFAGVAVPRAMVLCASGPAERSYASVGGPVAPLAYDEFLVHLCAALAGTYPGGRPLLSTVTSPPSIADAFGYARLHDAARETPSLTDPAGLASATFL